MVQTPINMDIENNPCPIECQGTSIPHTKDDPSFSLSIPNPQPTSISSSLAEEQRLRTSNGDMWPLYISQAEKHDPQLAKHWKGQTDTILNVAGLFSIVVAIFLTKAIGSLRPNSTELLLSQISLQLGQSANAAFLPVTDILSTHPSDLDVAVNMLWALSLIFSLTCAFSAMLVQQWIQEYFNYSRCHTVPSTRARIRAYLFDGLSQHRLDEVISAIPLLLHLSLLLFGAGLITCFFSLNAVVAYTALAVYSILGAVYILLSIAPLIDLSSPFKTPISNLLWRTLQWIQLTVLNTTMSLTSCVSLDSIYFRFRLPELVKACRERYHGGIVRAIEQELEITHPNADLYALRWAISSVRTDNELEAFVGAIPRFLSSERHNEYTIGELLEDSDVRLGWSIGRLLKTCVTSSCPVLSVRKKRAVTCARATWYITEKFTGTTTLYWDTLFGEETAESLKTLGTDFDPTISIFARCSAALAARSCLRELSEVSAWVQTKGPRWLLRARQLIDYINKLSGIGLPAEPNTVVVDGPLLTLATFLKCGPPGIGQMDDDLSFIVDTTVKYLVEDVRASEASLTVQKQFSQMVFSSGTYELWKRYLEPATSQALGRALDSLRKDIEPRVTEDWVDAGLPVPPGWFAPGVVTDGCRSIVPSYRQWSYDSSGTAFSGGAATPSSEVVPTHSPESDRDSSHKTVVRGPSSPSRRD